MTLPLLYTPSLLDGMRKRRWGYLMVGTIHMVVVRLDHVSLDQVPRKVLSDGKWHPCGLVF